jgi:hypothetical protein
VVCSVVCFERVGDGSVFGSDEEGALLESHEVGGRMGVPWKNKMKSSQGSEGDLLWPRALSWRSRPSATPSRSEAGESLGGCVDPTTSLNVSNSLLPSSFGSSRSSAASISWTEG